MTNHLWQSTLFAAAAGLLTLALRNNRAAVRYWIWLSASIKFLVPLTVLVSLWNPLERVPTPQTIVTSAVTVTEFVQPFSKEIVFSSPASGSSDWIRPALLAIWICGFLAISIIRLRAWLRIRQVVRASTPFALESDLQIRFAPGLLEPGVVGIWKPVLLLPADIDKYLSPVQFQAVLTHEQYHIARRDNLMSAIHMLVEAIFWFHPLVWWIGSRLVEERERACDEEVLRLGGEPRDYAEAIVNVCKRYTESPLACVSGVTGADLKKRIEAIMVHRGTLRLNWSKKFLLIGAGVAAACIPFLVGVVSAQSNRAFEVASIRPGGDGPRGDAFSTRPEIAGGTFRWTTQRAYLIGYAYELDITQVSGGGGAIYHIEAKFDPSASNRDIRQMVRSLLVERFKMQAHLTTKEGEGYALSTGKSGVKVKQASDEAESYVSATMPKAGIGQITAKNGSIAQLAQALQRAMGIPVWDRTGLSSQYDFQFQFATDPANEDAPWIGTALRETLGLNFEKTKGPVAALIVDHIEEPSEN